MKIALLVDGLESTRQFHADDGESLRDAMRLLRTAGIPAELVVVRDSAADAFFESIGESDIDGVVFASNSLRHKGGRIAAAVERHGDAITRFLEAGRGMLVLHQFSTELPALTLPNGGIVALERRENVDHSEVLPTELGDSHPVLNFPFRIEDIDRELSAGGQLGALKSWMRVAPHALEGFEIVVQSRAGEPLIVCSSRAMSWRVVVSAIPLDWHAALSLLANVTQFVAAGDPQVVVWPGAEAGHLASALGASRRSYVVTDDAVGAATWLRTRPAIHVVDRTDAPAVREHFSEAVAAGAVVLSARRTEHAQIAFAGLAGDRSARLATEYFSAVRPQALYQAGLDPFPTRNIVVAGHYFAELTAPSRALWDPRADAALARNLESLIFEGMTVTSLLAAVQAVRSAAPEKALEIRVLRLLDELLPEGEAAQLLRAGALVAFDRGSFDGFLDRVLGADAGALDPATAIRLLDWTGYLGGVLNLEAGAGRQRATVERLMSVAAGVEDDGVWLSVEGSAIVVMAVCSYATSPAELRALGPTLAGLRAEYRSATSDSGRASIAARIGHALAMAERVAPLLLDTVAAAIPKSASGANIADLQLERSRVASLANRNRELADDVEVLKRDARNRRALLVVGTVASWVVALGVDVSLAMLGVIVIVRWPTEGQLLAAPIAIGWLLVLAATARTLDAIGALPVGFRKPVRALWSNALQRIRGS